MINYLWAANGGSLSGGCMAGVGLPRAEGGRGAHAHIRHYSIALPTTLTMCTVNTKNDELG